MEREYEVVTHHMLRRTARKMEKKLQRANPRNEYAVRSSVRGPFGWYVVVLL